MSDVTIAPGRSMASLTLQRFLRHRMAVASAVVLAVLAAVVAAAPLVEMILGIDANQVDLMARFGPRGPGHPLGTDELGRDVLARLLYGGQISLVVALVTAAAAAIIGTAIGLVAGYYGGWVDAVLMRVTDGVIALPLLPLLIVLAAIDMSRIPILAPLAEGEGESLYRIVLIITLVGWTTVARLVRGAALTLREREYVVAARGMGASGLRIMATHILPNSISPIIVATTLSVGNIILFESVLSFLGLGIQPPIASWGNMLNNAQELIYEAPALAFYPGLLIFLTVIAFNFLGDGLQDALDPKAL
jgi:peptide/nickel transport system permease protein